MTSEKIEGTLVLDGLVQGRLADGDDQIESKLREWVGFVHRLGMRFSLQVTGATFSLLPETSAVAIQPLGQQPEDAVGQALEQLAELFVEPQRGQLFSTLRTSEFRKGEEVQTVYTIVQGIVRRHSRTVEADTTPPPQPLSTREKAKLAAVAAGILVVVLGLALLIPGVRSMFGEVVDVVKPFHADEIVIKLGPYKKFFSLALDEQQSNRALWTVKLTRTGEFPKTATQLDEAAKVAGDSVAARLVIDSLARGYVQVEFFDADDKYLGSIDLRIADLKAKESIEGQVQVPSKTKPARIVLIPQ
ncbi:MAG: hypothetical protein IT427_06295 [Pirellulales bacterium]|nr:hypothetical protein [Pirellulales bacterium]